MKPLLIIALLTLAQTVQAEPIFMYNYERHVGISTDEHIDTSIDTFRIIDQRRRERGLEPINFDPRIFGALYLLATEYSVTMATANKMQHGFPKSPLRYYLNLFDLQSFPAWEYNLVELIAWGPIPNYWTSSRMARVFDNSPDHSTWLYHEDIEHIGWGYAIRHNVMWMTAYLLVRK